MRAIRLWVKYWELFGSWRPSCSSSFWHLVSEMQHCFEFRSAPLNLLHYLIWLAGTLCVFPSIVSEIWECSNANNAAFTAILFLVFNIFDAIGRAISGFANEYVVFIRLIWSFVHFVILCGITWISFLTTLQRYSVWLLYTLLTLAVGKLSVVPLLTGANIHGREFNNNSCNDFYPVLLITLLGLTNGFCASCCMMHWSKVSLMCIAWKKAMEQKFISSCFSFPVLYTHSNLPFLSIIVGAGQLPEGKCGCHLDDLFSDYWTHTWILAILRRRRICPKIGWWRVQSMLSSISLDNACEGSVGMSMCNSCS